MDSGEVIDLTQSDDEQPASTRTVPTTRRAPTRRPAIPAAVEIIEVSEDEDDAQTEDDYGALDGNLVGPPPATGPQQNELPTELPPSPHLRAPAVSRRDAPFSRAEVVLHMFTDGSLINNRFGGAGVSWRDHRNTWHGRAIAVGRARSSNEAELHAVLEGLKAAHAILDRRPDVTKVIVQTDSETCLIDLARARAAGGGHYGLLDETLRQETLLKSRVAQDVKIWWVKGHSDSVGNDIADNLARYGAEQARASPATWGMMTENPPSAKLDQANRLRHGDRKPRKGVAAPQTRRAQKEAVRRARGGQIA